MRERGVGARVGLADARVDAAEVEGGPLEARTERVAAGAAARETEKLSAVDADRPDEEDAREEVGDLDADPRRRAREVSLGGADVGASAQQAGGVADRNLARAARDRLAHLELGNQLGREAAGEHAEPVDRRPDRGLEQRDLRAGTLELRLRLRGIELRAAALLEQRVGEVERRGLVLRVARRDLELLLQAAQLDVCAADLAVTVTTTSRSVSSSRPMSSLAASTERRMRPQTSSSQVASKPASKRSKVRDAPPASVSLSRTRW
jgi:hypothetical protein